MAHIQLIICGILFICPPLDVSQFSRAIPAHAETDPEKDYSLPAIPSSGNAGADVPSSSAEGRDAQKGEPRESGGNVRQPTPSSETPPAVQDEKKEESPDGGVRQQPDQSGQKNNEEQPETIVDALHAGISRGIKGTATWMDSFFGDRRYLSELNTSYIRFRYNMFLEDRSGLLRKPELQFRMVLPQLREKTRLVFSGTPSERSEFSAFQSNSQSDQIASDERNVTAGVDQTLRETTFDNIMIRAGLRFHDGRPAVMLGPRYRILFPLDSWNLRFVEEVLWRSNIGWEAKSTADIERPLPPNLFFRGTNEWIWKEHLRGYVYAFIFYLGQPINHRRGLEYEWVNLFHTKPINELTEVTLRVRYRQQFWREWLYFEIDPQCRFPRDRSFEATPGILFRIEIIMGNYR